MTGWRVLSPEQVEAVAAYLAALPAPLSADAPAEAVGRLGWPVVAGPSFGGAVLHTGLPPYDGFADLRFTESGATAVVVRVTDPAPDSTPGATAFRRDAFAMAFGALSGTLGPPAQRQPGEFPQVCWPVPAGLLRLRDDGSFVELALLSPDHPTAHLAETADNAPDDFDDPDGLDDSDGLHESAGLHDSAGLDDSVRLDSDDGFRPGEGR